MYSKSTYRPRRTRIYGANYDIGESYYKGALDNLDSKSKPKSIRFADTNSSNDDDLFLSRPGRMSPESRFSESRSMGNKLGEDISTRRNLLKAGSEERISKNLNHRFNSMQNDVTSALVDANALRYTPEIQFVADKSAKNDKVSVSESSLRRKNCSIIQECSSSQTRRKNFFDEDDIKGKFNNTSKSTQFDVDTLGTSASLRAKATKMRLENLESEMMKLSEKQNEREKRNLNLKNLLSESDLVENFPMKLALKSNEDKFL